MSLATLLNNDAIRTFLQDGDVYDALLGVAERHKLPDDRVNEFLDLTDAVLDEQIPLAEIPALLAEAFGLSEEASRALAVEIVGIRLLPLEVFFPGIAEQIKAWGGDLAAFPGTRIEKEAITAEALAEQVAAKAGVNFSELLMKRLAFLLEQRASGQKTDESLRLFLGRPLTIGGMGLAKEQIDALMAAATEAISSVRIVSEDVETAGPAVSTEMTSRVDDGDNETMDPGSVPGMTSVTALEIPPSHEVAAEVPVISSPKRSIAFVMPDTDPASIAINLVSNDGSRVPASPAGRKPGMTEDETPDIQSKKKAEKAKKMEDEAVKVAFSEAIDLALQKAHEVLEQAKIPSAAFADAVGKMLRGIRDMYQTRALFERDYHVQGAVLASLMQALLEAQEAYRVATDALAHVAGAETQVSEKDAATLEEQEAIAMDAKFAQLTKDSPKPAPARVELTVGSVVPVRDDGVLQKKVTDIVAGNRLMGPVEQLGTMTLADFRRLSTNPEEAVRKMEALLLSLQKTSYEDRVRGVLAWRKSPLAKLAITLTTESLNTGVAVAEIAARRRSQGQESLGPAEMQALAKWNEKVRF